ncbi:MAG: hypothetical protein K5785_09275 [Nitrosarchaeum sp.]|nr:hypothetical protein [Nitrosarchaeum sp.]
MARDKINEVVLNKILNHTIIKNKKIKKQSIRDGASKIKKDNHGITSSAAAYEWARKNHGISVYRYLSKDDVNSLQYLKDLSPSPKKNQSNRKIKAKKTITSYGQRYITNANQNADIYPHVYILENSLRDLILKKFQDEKNWWTNTKIVKPDIQKYAQTIMDAEKKHRWLDTRGDHPIYYVGLEHLLKIIEMSYNPYFKNIFELTKLKTWIEECIPIRHLLAHNIKTSKEEQDNIKIRTKYICTLIEKQPNIKNKKLGNTKNE